MDTSEHSEPAANAAVGSQERESGGDTVATQHTVAERVDASECPEELQAPSAALETATTNTGPNTAAETSQSTVGNTAAAPTAAADVNEVVGTSTAPAGDVAPAVDMPIANEELQAAQSPELVDVAEQMEVPENVELVAHSDDGEAEVLESDPLDFANDARVSSLSSSPASLLHFEASPTVEPLPVDDEMGEQLDSDDDDIDDVEVRAPPLDEDDNLMLDISDAASSPGNVNININIINNDDHMRQAFRELLLHRRGGSYRDNFMQRLRSAFFTMEHRGRNRRGTDSTENNETEPVPEPEPEPEEVPENAVCFDTNLPAEHSYLGSNMNRVSGVNYLEVGQHYMMMLFMHQHVLFPGEVLPFMISGTIIESDIDAQNGFIFGVCFPVLCSNDSDDNFYGVTCQIYEKGTDSRGNTLIKSRALQRFVVKGDDITGPLQFIAAHPQLKCKGNIKILPEIYLSEPLKCINMGSMNRFRDNESMRVMYRRYQAVGTPWPPHIYNYYSISDVIEKARTQLAQHKIDTMPSEPTQLSFWLVRNLHLSDDLMKEIFTTDSVNKRLQLISNTFTEDSLFTCRYCGNRIANCSQLFAMSKHGVQTQYCNSAGYIHETNTVYQLLPDAITYSGEPSSEFSWFPGYEWHIIVCKICSRHIGWKFKGLEPNLMPKQFFGISSSSVRISSPKQPNDSTRAVVLQSLMRLARGEMQ